MLPLNLFIFISARSPADFTAPVNRPPFYLKTQPGRDAKVSSGLLKLMISLNQALLSALALSSAA